MPTVMGGCNRLYSRITDQFGSEAIPAAASSDDHIQQSEGSSSMPTTIDDIPDLVLVEILCRLPCKFLFQCKCVSKSWCTLIQDPYLSGRFMRLQSDRRTPVVSTVINTRGEECLTTLWPSTCKPLTRLFKKLMRFYHLIEKPNVLATYNDLVLCCSLECSYQGDYYICNPYTIQWARLPPPPRIFRFVATGFICDLPHYNHKKEDDPKGNIIQLNAEYRYKVVRIISTDMSASKFEVQMFSSETGKWKESIVSSPWKFSRSVVHHNIKSFAFNGMLYWMDMDKRFLIQLDTFSGDIGDQNAWRFVHFGQVESRQQCCVGIFKGRLLIGEYNFPGGTLSFGELSEEHIQLGGETRKLYGRQKDIEMVYLPDIKPDGVTMKLISFEPSEEDILDIRIYPGYRETTRVIAKYNICTGKWSKIFDMSVENDYFSLALPWWPTPVPRLPHRRQLAQQTQLGVRCPALDLSTSKSQPARASSSKVGCASVASNAKVKVKEKVVQNMEKKIPLKRRRVWEQRVDTGVPRLPHRRQLAQQTQQGVRCPALDLSTSKSQLPARASSSKVGCISVANNAKVKVKEKVVQNMEKKIPLKRRRVWEQRVDTG